MKRRELLKVMAVGIGSPVVFFLPACGGEDVVAPKEGETLGELLRRELGWRIVPYQL